MGKIRTKLIGLEEVEKEQAEKARARREAKKATKEVQRKAVAPEEKQKDVQAAPAEEKKQAKSPKKSAVKKPGKSKGKNYREAAKKIDRSKSYRLKDAVALLKKIRYASFDETVEIHCNLKEKEVKGEVQLPHGIGKETTVAVVSDAVIATIESGKIDFDVLIARPSDMPKLVKLAKVLGPKGLMPNPKAGTVSDKPEEAAKKFTGGMLRFKSEAKFPLLHQAVGKTSFKEADLVENIEIFINALNKAKIASAFLKTTMSPSIRLELEEKV